MSKKKGSGASGTFKRKTGGTTLPPAATHFRCSICNSKVPKGTYTILRDGLPSVVSGCLQDHESLRARSSVVLFGHNDGKHGIPLSEGQMQKLQAAFQRGDHDYLMRVRPN